MPQLAIRSPASSCLSPVVTAVNDGERLRRLLLDGQIVLAMVLPAVVWVAIAKPILLTWVGRHGALGFMLQCMMVVLAADRFCGSGDMVLMGMGQVRAAGVAYLTSSVLAMNLLTVLLWWTDVGVYSVPAALSVESDPAGVVLMRMCRGVAVSVGRYVGRARAASLAMCGRRGAILSIARHYWFGPGWTSLIASALLSGTVHLIATWLMVMTREQRGTALAWLRPGRASGVALK